MDTSLPDDASVPPNTSAESEGQAPDSSQPSVGSLPKTKKEKGKSTCKPQKFDWQPKPGGGAGALIMKPSDATLAHEIVSLLIDNWKVEKELLDGAEQQWQAVVSNLSKMGLFDSSLAVYDVNESMTGEAVNVAIALSLLMATLAKPPFDGLVCSTFAKTSLAPQLHTVDKELSLKEKVDFIRRIGSGIDIDLQAVFNLLLTKAKADQLLPKQMIQTIFILTENEYHQSIGKKYAADYIKIQSKFEESGYPLPGVVFWNLGDGDRAKPVIKQDKNVAIVSGYSDQMLRNFFTNGAF